MTIFVDMDGTLSDDRHRQHLIQSGQFDEYHALLTHDKPFTPLMRMIHSLQNTGQPIIGLTARPERYKMNTLAWCESYAILLDGVLMRPTDNWEKAPQLKLSLLVQFYHGSPDVARENCVAIFEDRDDVCELLRNEGFPVFQTRINVGAAR